MSLLGPGPGPGPGPGKPGVGGFSGIMKPTPGKESHVNLMLVREHVEKMGGRLRVRQVSGFGLAFWVWLSKGVLRRKTARPS